MSDRFRFNPFTDLQNCRESIHPLFERGWVLPRDRTPSILNAIVIPIERLDNGLTLPVSESLRLKGIRAANG